MILTFGYGSNMCFGRMKHRVKSLEFVAVAVLDDYRFVMNKLSKDGSAKGNIQPDSGERVFGVVYSLDEADLDTLNRYEGFGEGYVLRDDLQIHDIDGSNLGTRILVYLADDRYVVHDLWPYSWYLRHILEGARQHQLPAEYIGWLEKHPASDDPDRLRDQQQRMYPCDRQLVPEERRAIAAAGRRDPSRLTDYAEHFRRLDSQ